MSSEPARGNQTRNRQSIPLQDLLTLPPNDYTDSSATMRHGASSSDGDFADVLLQADSPRSSTNWHTYSRDEDATPSSPIDPTVLQAALPPDFGAAMSEERSDSHSFIGFDASPYAEESNNAEFLDSDRVPLTAQTQPISGSLSISNDHDRGRDSFQTVSDLHTGSSIAHLSANHGQDLGVVGLPARHHHSSYGASLDPNQYRVSHSSSTSDAFLRASSMVRAMSQRVVNFSGESDALDRRSSPRASIETNRSHHAEQNPSPGTLVDTAYRPETHRMTPEKAAGGAKGPSFVTGALRPNPLRGHTLGIFSPDNRLRKLLCNALINPFVEPCILALIILQAILLAVEAAPNVFTAGHQRPSRWGTRWIDWIMLVLFIIFTLELVARAIVSGFFFNAEEYSTIDRKKGVKAAIAEQYRTLFRPERRKSVKGNRHMEPQQSAFSRSFTTIMQGQQTLPATIEDQQRFQLARRALLRHSFNRLDFIAVVSFWISFALGIAGLESQHNMYLFKMLSCLRILRLLALTNGTAVRKSLANLLNHLR